MRKVVSHLISTLDGVVKFDAVAETIEKLRDTKEVLADYFGKLSEEDAMLLGRVTYEEWKDHWPARSKQPFADHINRVPKYVVSKSLDAAPWGSGHATLVSGDLTDAITDLKRQAGKNIGIHGSPSLVESLLHANLLDELRLEVYPVVAGIGERLFHEGKGSKPMQLVNSKITGNGVAILTYRPGG